MLARGLSLINAEELVVKHLDFRLAQQNGAHVHRQARNSGKDSSCLLKIRSVACHGEADGVLCPGKRFNLRCVAGQPDP